MADETIKAGEGEKTGAAVDAAAAGRDTSAAKESGKRLTEPAQGDLDSVRMYLSGIGCVDLLSREEEVELAKAIEVARNAVLDGVLDTQLGIGRILELPKLVRKGLRSLRQVLDGSSNQEPDEETGLNGVERIEAVALDLKSVARARK